MARERRVIMAGLDDTTLERSLVARASDAAFRQVDEAMFIVGAGTGRMVMLNETGTVLWAYLDRPRSLSELADKLCEDFEVDGAEAARDCRAFVEQLGARGLVRLCPASPATE